MNPVVVIPARGGSVRIPRKNVRPFYGRPIIQYSIELAQSCGLDVVVSTEDPEIAQLALDLGCQVRQRPFALARDEVGTHEVWADAVESLGIKRGRVACLYPCAPLLDKNDFIIGLGGSGYALTVGTNPLRDAGAAYWGDARDLRKDVPLINERTRLIPLIEEDVCDINTERDWFIAESRYALKHGIDPQLSGLIRTVADPDVVDIAEAA